MFGQAKDAYDALSDENRMWDFADKHLPDPGKASQPKRAKGPLPQTSKAPESKPQMFASGGSVEGVVSHAPKVIVAKDLTGLTRSASSGSKPPSLSQQALAEGRGPPVLASTERPTVPKKNTRPAAI
eukprot:4829745-Karenia_brevis.AAC.1